MKRTLLLITLSAASIAVAGSGGLALKRFDHDFGVITAGARVDQNFSFENVTNAPITLLELKGPTGTTKLDRTIPPRGSSEIRLSWTSSPVKKLDPVVQRFEVVTNDPAQKSYLLKLRGKVQPPIQVEPLALQKAVRRKATDELSFLITETSGKPLVIKDFRDVPEGLICEAVPLAQRQDQVKVVVKIRDGAPLGLAEGTIQAVLEDPNAKAVELPVKLQVMGDLQAMPPEFQFRKLGKVEQEASVILTDLEQSGNFQVLSAEDQSGLLDRVEVQPVVLGKKYAVVAFSKKDGTSGKVKVTTNHPTEKELLLTYRFIDPNQKGPNKTTN